MSMPATTPSAIPTAVLASLISAAVSAVVAYVISRRTLRAHRRQHLETMVTKMIDMAFAYPYLEDDSFCSSWDSMDRTSTESQRYDNYCCFVFNTLETIWKFCGGNSRNIDEMIYAHEVVHRHRRWWTSQAVNVVGYHSDFCNYVNNLLVGTQNAT